MAVSDPPVSGSRPKGEMPRGLPSIAEARRERQTQPKVWTWITLVLAVGLVVWWKVDSGKIDDLRSQLLSRQREVAARLGPSWVALRDRAEKWTGECAADKLEEVKGDKLVATWDFRSMPGVYLRLAKSNAGDSMKIRAAAGKSFHDGFTSCLFTSQNTSPVAGTACQSTLECPRGQICNEFRQCAEHGQPYNLRIAYRAMYVLSDEWVENIQSLRNDLELRGAMQTFDATEKYDLPVATELLSQAKYFMVVVDESVEGGEPEVAADAGPPTDDRSISATPHAARVCLWRLEDGKKMLALRREGAGELMGGTPANDETRLARQRQANSCALALSVRDVIER